MEIRTQEDFQRLLETDFGEGRYGYGSAWDSAYVYNELSEFINFFWRQLFMTGTARLPGKLLPFWRIW